MWLIKAFVPGEARLTGESHLGQYRSIWERVRLAPPAPPTVHVGCWIPDDHPDAITLPARVKGMRGFEVAKDKAVTRVDAPVASPTPAAESVPARLVNARAEHVAALVIMVRARGWDFEDMAGTGLQGDPSETGGRSPRSGLTLGELALTRPPSDWEKLAAKHRPPWESGDWQAPVPTWRPPSWPEPVAPVPVPASQPGEPMNDGTKSVSEEPPVDTGGTPDGAPPADDAGSKPPADEGEPKTEKKTEQTETTLPWEPDVAKAVIEVLVALRAAKDGKIPTHNTANFMLKKAGLPTVSKKQIDLIFAAAAAA